MTLNIKKFTDALKGSVSRAAETIASMSTAKPKVVGGGRTVTAKAGKPGAPYRRIIKQRAEKVWFVQTGIRVKEGHAPTPILERVERHSFLHATKGWRTYRDGLPAPGRRGGAPAMPRNPFHSPACHRACGTTTVNKKGAPIVHLGWRKIAHVAKDGTVTPLKAA